MITSATPFSLNKAEIVSSIGQKILQHVREELKKLREQNEFPMPEDKRNGLIARITVYKDVEKWFDEKAAVDSTPLMRF